MATILEALRVCVCVRESKQIISLLPLPSFTHKPKNMFEQHKTALLVCTCEHIAPLNTAMGCWSLRSRCWPVVCMCVCARGCESMWRRGGNTTHTITLFIPFMSMGLVWIAETESYESNQVFVSGVGGSVYWLDAFAGKAGQRERMSFSAISKHLWQSLKCVKFASGSVGGCVSENYCVRGVHLCHRHKHVCVVRCAVMPFNTTLSGKEEQIQNVPSHVNVKCEGITSQWMCVCVCLCLWWGLSFPQLRVQLQWNPFWLSVLHLRRGDSPFSSSPATLSSTLSILPSSLTPAVPILPSASSL